MAKKSLICCLAILVLFMFSGICFAANSENSINLGNEIMQSIDKTDDSFKNVVSGNIVKDGKNMITDGVNNVENGMRNTEENIGNGINNTEHSVNNEVNNGKNTIENNRNYNTTRTTAESGTAYTGTNTMTTTTWMWIILVVAAVIIIAAIWYYATQNNS